MKIHEYQAKRLFQKYNIPVPMGNIAYNAEEAKKIAEKLKTTPLIIKAQIHAGGRGKGGGVKSADSIQKTMQVTNEIIGTNLITAQTGSQGKKVSKVLIEEKLNILKEMYLSISQNRNTAADVIMASTSGGMDIESVAKESPEKIIKISINPLLGLKKYHCRQLAYGLGLKNSHNKEIIKIISSLYEMYVTYDCTLVEINPLVLTKNNNFFALDAKIEFDPNSLYKHKNILSLRDTKEEDPLDVKASKYNLNYINLSGNGNIGNMVNGAGLAMATMDIIKQANAEPANFLDVGGGATSEMIENGLKIIANDNRIKGILINIFGGILRCDVLAKGLIKAVKEINLKIPIVIRLEGTNELEGKKMLTKSGLKFIMADNLKEAADQITKIVS